MPIVPHRGSLSLSAALGQYRAQARMRSVADEFAGALGGGLSLVLEEGANSNAGRREVASA